MGLLDKVLKKAAPAPAKPPRVHVPSPDEALLHPLCVAGTHVIIVCAKPKNSLCREWFRCGKDYPINFKCNCGGPLVVHRKGSLVARCNKWRSKIVLDVEKELAHGWCKTLRTHCPLERAANAFPGECISHPNYVMMQNMRRYAIRKELIALGFLDKKGRIVI